MAIAGLGLPPWAVLGALLGIASAALFHLLFCSQVGRLPLYLLIGTVPALLGGPPGYAARADAVEYRRGAPPGHLRRCLERTRDCTPRGPVIASGLGGGEKLTLADVRDVAIIAGIVVFVLESLLIGVLLVVVGLRLLVFIDVAQARLDDVAVSAD